MRKISLYQCQMECLRNLRCLAFFYNNVNRLCILHETTFKYTTPLKSETGWKFYENQDGSGQCPSNDNFLFHREYNLCYSINYAFPMDYDVMNASCQAKDAELIKIRNEKIQNYTELVTAGAPVAYISIQGTDNIYPNRSWSWDDGKLMTYFKWDIDANQPTGGGDHIVMSIHYQYEWYDFAMPSNTRCIYICERRISKT
ncbi:unnamed protein product [Mytilus coruscus]|uniref:C-type lectin domain-containing protein n=1 Tax=Mytilus coruscus TaxID=42192 RepID=A0A6J8F0G1_MYTCO|nr:unnamed protein product [Mytilus coruscus]